MGSNQAVQAEPVLDKGPGDSVSFDELESVLESSKDHTPESELPNKTEDKEEEVKEEDEPKQATDIEKAAAKAKLKADAKAEEAKTESEKAAKLVKFKIGDKENALPVDAMVEIPIRGKKELVKLSDLTSEFSGKTDWNRRYSELNKERQEFNKQSEVLQSYVNELHTKLVEEKDATGALWLLAEAMGGNPVNVITTFKKQLLEQLDSYKDLSPEERKVKELEEQIALRQRQEESTAKARESQKVTNELESRTQKVLEQHGLERDKFVELYQDLKTKLAPEEITPERIGEYHQALQRWDALDQMLGELNPDLQNKDGSIEEMMDLMQKHPEFTIEDVREIASEVYGSKQSKNLARKLKKTTPANTARTPRSENPVSWDEVD